MYYFTDDCLTGMKQIDDEHRELFRILNELHELFANEFIEDKYDHTRELLDRLRDYTQCHFAHEEAYMESIAHPELELQRRQHNAFTAKISEMDAILPSGSQQAFLDDLLQYLVTWLYRHIISSDMMIGKLIPAKENRPSFYRRIPDRYRADRPGAPGAVPDYRGSKQPDQKRIYSRQIRRDRTPSGRTVPIHRHSL